ncbi:hypothetical protein CIG11343_0584 [Campylobacter iguaniorum]|uniref:hypothetical protein n=1 Tax=Campylobacter iguaniorum TaxID=1244531 RepID=UPI0007C90B43|nr:hypothetical protein [Campylobacter iguaniorum]ANE35645.1 hypothetical protein CIG11343_0584 [Campylobacter iguaniorum]
MLKQNINGVITTVQANGSEADIQALIGIMAGEITEYELKGQGGTEVAQLPNPVNKKVIILGKKATQTTGRLSTQISIPHVKPAKTFNEISADIRSKFTANYDVADKADYVSLKFDK